MAEPIQLELAMNSSLMLIYNLNCYTSQDNTQPQALAIK